MFPWDSIHALSFAGHGYSFTVRSGPSHKGSDILRPPAYAEQQQRCAVDVASKPAVQFGLLGVQLHLASCLATATTRLTITTVSTSMVIRILSGPVIAMVL